MDTSGNDPPSSVEQKHRRISRRRSNPDQKQDQDQDQDMTDMERPVKRVKKNTEYNSLEYNSMEYNSMEIMEDELIYRDYDAVSEAGYEGDYNTDTDSDHDHDTTAFKAF
ncbi:uncharacterized protein [Drosophila kikkawai]|uniref:Uncharacterized protein n=1 Tax=Drosophila kikkawai TaxID=30033 RepID=A0ABM4GP73_DROKI